MKDIEVGEYVRTRNHGIKRIDTIFKNKTVNKYGYECGSEWDGKLYSYIKTTDILKHSHNIIKLVEKDDYVNGHRVEQISVETNEVLLDHNGYGWRTLKKDDRTVTHEQFNQNCYRLEE